MSRADEERAALAARLGPGARRDAREAPAEALLLARRGAAYFARLLNDLPDDALAGRSARPDWSRARVTAHVGYHARWLAEAIASLAGGPVPEGPDPAARAAQGASLPARALRGLVAHATLHLDVEWRDLPGPLWEARVPLGPTPLAARDTPMLRARTIWRAALDLDAGGRIADLPQDLRGPV